MDVTKKPHLPREVWETVFEQAFRDRNDKLQFRSQAQKHELTALCASPREKQRSNYDHAEARGTRREFNKC